MDFQQRQPTVSQPKAQDDASVGTSNAVRPPGAHRAGRKAGRKSRPGSTTGSTPGTPLHRTGSPLAPSSTAADSELSSCHGSSLASTSVPIMRRNTVSDSGSSPTDIARRLDFERSVSHNNLAAAGTTPPASPRARASAGAAPAMATVFEREVQPSGLPSQVTRQGSAFITPQASLSPAAALPAASVAPAASSKLQEATSATATSTTSNNNNASSSSSSSSQWPVPGFFQYLAAEAQPPEKYPTADVVWRQTERDRVYNYLLYVPYQLERVMTFGTCLCLWSYLGTLTLLPLRCCGALLTLFTAPASRSRNAAGAYAPGSAGLLPGNQLYDLLCLGLLVTSLWTLLLVPPGAIYYWMKDIISEFLRIQVLFTALELLDKILANFGVDVLEALSSSCTLYSRRTTSALHLASDLLVAYCMITLHAAVLMCQAMVFAVAMNSKRYALLALLIASNFVEIKGSVNKRTDTNKLWALACLDIVERCHLLLVLAFVVVEDISNSGGWLPAASTLMECGRIFLWEVVIDVIKHAVLGKFNDIRPGIHREYMRDLCQDSLDRQSYNVHKLVGFFPLGPAVLGLRMLATLLTLRHGGQTHWFTKVVVAVSLWLLACGLQVLFGYLLKLAAGSYVAYRDSQAGGKPQPRVLKQPVDRDAGSSRPGAGGAGAQGPGGPGAAAGGAGGGPTPVPGSGPPGLVIPPFVAPAAVATPTGVVQPSVAAHLAVPATAALAGRSKWE